MKQRIIIANWKSEKSLTDALNWMEDLSEYVQQSSSRLDEFHKKTIMLCPSFILLPSLAVAIKEHKLPIILGSQDISSFDQGAYTGEVNGKQMKEFIAYTLVGHSERRINFHEDNTILEQKVKQAIQNNIKPVFCVQGVDTYIPKDVSVLAYEPVFAIGTGIIDSPINAEKLANTKKKNSQIDKVLYGGSVSEKNVIDFTSQPSIDGVLVGKASLDPISFAEIVINA